MRQAPPHWMKKQVAKGALQSFLPHETLVFLPDGPGDACHPEVFSRGVISDDTESFLRATKAG